MGLAVDRFAEPFRAELNGGGVPFGITRVGFHTGPAVVDNFGARTRFDDAAQGDAVNTGGAARRPHKYPRSRICVREETQARCPGVDFRPLGIVTVKGKSTALTVYEPLLEERAATPLMAQYRTADEKLAAVGPATPALWEALQCRGRLTILALPCSYAASPRRAGRCHGDDGQIAPARGQKPRFHWMARARSFFPGVADRAEFIVVARRT